MRYLKTICSSPFIILALTIIIVAALFSMPDHVNFMLEGALLLIGRSLLGFALMLVGVFVSRKARAAFTNGDANGSTMYVVPAVYVGCAFIVGCAIIANTL